MRSCEGLDTKATEASPAHLQLRDLNSDFFAGVVCVPSCHRMRPLLQQAPARPVSGGLSASRGEN